MFNTVLQQRCTESEIFDSDSTPASAEYTPTPKHFQVLDPDSCLNSKLNAINFCLNDCVWLKKTHQTKLLSSAKICNLLFACQLLLRLRGLRWLVA